MDKGAAKAEGGTLAPRGVNDMLSNPDKTKGCRPLDDWEWYSGAVCGSISAP